MNTTRSINLLAAALAALTIGLFALAHRPHPAAGVIPGPDTDASEYAYGALALLHGAYTVNYPRGILGGVPHVPRFTPGLAALLAPAVALGGVEAAVWAPYLAALALLVLAAGLAWRLGGPVAAMLATVSLATTGLVGVFADVVMSELPSAALALAMLALLVRGSRRALIAAGVLGAAIVWVRPVNGVLLVPALVALAGPGWRGRAASYLAGAAPLLAGLLLWQWRLYGTPLVSGYQVSGAGAAGGHALTTFFSLRYIVSRPWAITPLVWLHVPGQSNAAVYALALAGTHRWLGTPLALLPGLVAPFLWLRRRDAHGIYARFAVTALAATLAVYLPYAYQDPRFLVVPVVCAHLGAAVLLGGRRAWRPAPGRLNSRAAPAAGTAPSVRDPA